MRLPRHKTKIVCTIGPSSFHPAVLRGLYRRGMSVARINLSHGDQAEKRDTFRKVRDAARAEGKICAILADLPGPKIRLGDLAQETIVLTAGKEVTLTTRRLLGSPAVLPVNYQQLPRSVKTGSLIYLYDGYLQLRVLSVARTEVLCRVLIGGKVSSRKGINLPGAHLYVNPVTRKDLDWMKFCLGQGIRMFGVSFVEKAADLVKIRKYAASLGHRVHLIAKIERSEAVENLAEILRAADGLMVARGDLGVQVPIEDVPVLQKWLIHEAKLLGKPVITATQMLASMTENPRPTRAEVTDVANAIVDGTDAVMLSEETAMGKYPLQAVETMAKVAASMERRWQPFKFSRRMMEHFRGETAAPGSFSVEDLVSSQVVEAMRALKAKWILTPTHSGATALRISRFKPASWVLAFSENPRIHEFLSLAYGVQGVPSVRRQGSWHVPILKFLQQAGLAKTGEKLILTEGSDPTLVGGTNSFRVIVKGVKQSRPVASHA